MEKKTLIHMLAETPEDQILLARIWERFSAGIQRNIPVSSCFLSGREQQLAKTLLERGGMGEPMLFGGTADAERKVLVYIPDYYDPRDYLYGEDGPVSAVGIGYSSYDSLSHRDFLGGLMGQGIKREVLGDLLVGEHFCQALVLREMAEYLTRYLTHVGRVKVDVQEISLQELQIPKKKVKVIHDTVASLRLDAVIASGFGQGRNAAVACIRGGRVEVNHRIVLKPDLVVSEGDLFSVRGMGRMRLVQVKGQTKKCRIAIVMERYL